MSDENITFVTPDYSLNPKLSYFGNNIRVEFDGSCLKQAKITYNLRKIDNCIVYEVNQTYDISSYPTLEIVYLVQLVWLKTVMLININILGMLLDLIEKGFFSRQWSW